MIRHEAGGRAAFANGAPRGAGELRPKRARPRAALLAWRLLVPVLALAAALAGILYVLLLPVCGIATIAEGVARASWLRLRRAVARRSRSSTGVG